jgi:hypothetical protein
VKCDTGAVIACFRKPGERGQLAMIADLAASGPAGLKTLQRVYEEAPGIDVRRWVVHGLASFPGKEARRIIRLALRDPAMSVRLHAIRAIMVLGDRSLGQQALALIDDASGGIRMNLLDMAVALRVRGYRGVIARGLVDAKAYIRARAAQYAGT